MSPSKNLFVTGFPGLVGTAVVQRLLARHAPAATLTCLVEPGRLELARERRRELVRRLDKPEECLRLVEGDIGRYDLGCAPDERGERSIVEIFHLAALADPAAPREAALRVNVEGTRHLLDLAFRCPRLRRFHFLGTCYVSGSYEGLFGEEDFDLGQELRNVFEETRYAAEALVRQRIPEGLDATIYRPSTILPSRGSAAEGERGLELLLPFLQRLSQLAVAPVLGDASRYRVNAVPLDYVAEALVYLAELPQARGRVYHLCDPSAPTVEDLLQVLQLSSGQKALRLPLPPRLARWALERSALLRRSLSVSPELLDYITRPTRYSSRYALRDLATAHITCPPLLAWLPRLLHERGLGGSHAVA